MKAALGAAAFPYLKRDLYESSVIAKRKHAGVPIVGRLGLAAIYFYYVSTYLVVSVGNLPRNLQSRLTYRFIFGLGIVIYGLLRCFTGDFGFDSFHVVGKFKVR